MDEKKDNHSNHSDQDIQVSYSLKLALIGGLLATLGDAISTYAASLAIDEFLQESEEQNEKDQQLEERLAAIERKLDAFQNKTE
ncbi:MULTISPECIES: hypothetical protein [Oceanobacillus]|uniref:hypothetical protein n=1 Tax=Oceanobacillus TaxID=182709 RepID=UPI002115D555|nr:hypothetical protein [Oceanobacillus oncorhynchi]UUI40829.1 hypothetical protein NP440_04360 [Oceanobacillus oncorhynchi]